MFECDSVSLHYLLCMRACAGISCRWRVVDMHIPCVLSYLLTTYSLTERSRRTTRTTRAAAASSTATRAEMSSRAEMVGPSSLSPLFAQIHVISLTTDVPYVINHPVFSRRTVFQHALAGKFMRRSVRVLFLFAAQSWLSPLSGVGQPGGTALGLERV